MEDPAAICGARDQGTKSTLALNRSELEEYHREGFVIRRGLFSPEEAASLLDCAQSDSFVLDRAHGRKDSDGCVSKLSLWNTCGVNIYGALARSARVVDSVEQILGGFSHGCGGTEEAYHYHTKVMIKEAKIGGKWEWHQDYGEGDAHGKPATYCDGNHTLPRCPGYWYSNGCLAPKMLSVMVALNEHTVENGCLHVMPRTHHLGRITHQLTGGQAGADMERVRLAEQQAGQVPVLLQPGDTLFFHCNLLHASPQNRSDGPRWSIITAYNAKSNDPFREHHHPRYTPLDRWHDETLLQLAGQGITEGDGTEFMRAAEDDSAKGEGQADSAPVTTDAKA